jgi:hypothetical protein
MCDRRVGQAAWNQVATINETACRTQRARGVNLRKAKRAMRRAALNAFNATGIVPTGIGTVKTR